MKKLKQQASNPSQLQIAVQHHQAGRLEQADVIYKKMPGHPDAMHLSGVIAYQMGNHDLAIERINEALKLNSSDATYHCHLGLAYGALKNMDQAIASYQKAIALMPDYADAHNNLGAVLNDQGKTDEALPCFQKALALNPGYVEAHNNLGNVLQSQGERDEAAACYKRALALRPDYVEAINNLGAVLRDQGRLDEAVAYYQSALAFRPDLFELHYNLGNTLKQQRKLSEAATCYQNALALRPDMAKAYNNLGAVFKDQGKLDDAVTYSQKALALSPDMVEAHTCLGDIFRVQGHVDQAIACFERAIALKPDFSDAYHCLGAVFLYSQGKLDQALACFERAIALKPDFIDAYNGLGMTLQSQGKLDEAIACYRRAIELDPGYSVPHDNLLFCHNYHPTLSATEIFSAYQHWNEQQAAKFCVNLPPFTNIPDPLRRLKIGYVSPDFRNHSVIHFAAPLLEQHDKSRFEVYCYYTHFLHDACTDRIISASDHWIPCLEMSDDQIAQRIRDDGIDILIDLAGHTGGNRLLVFARQPAPVQVSWLGYGYTTGLTTMDYFIGDPVFTPPGSETLFSEALYRLPHTTWVYQPPAAAPEPGPLPAEKNGYVTFACVSTTTRINMGMIEAWANILRRIPGAHLRLDQRNFGDPGMRCEFEEKFALLGVQAEQLEIGFTSPVWSVYQNVDIVLDCFPHNSGTTTFEALWMGLPVVTLADRPSVGRFGASILSCIGRTEWIATDREDYISRALALAQDIASLKQTRASLRESMRNSSLLDHHTFRCDMEAAYRDMWGKWCATQPADSKFLLQTALEHHHAGRLQEAESIYKTVPDCPDAMHLLGIIAVQTGQNALAIERISRAISANPMDADYYCNLGSAYQALNRLDEAVASYRQALALNPDFSLAYNNLGNTLKDSGKPEEAIASFQKALAVKPDYVAAYSNLGSVLNSLGRLDEAVAAYQQAIAIKPDFAEAHFNLGNAFSAHTKLNAAISCFQKALAYKPDFYLAHNNFGLVLKDMGNLDDALICFQNALTIKPDFVNANSNLLFCVNYHPTLSPEQIFAVYQQWNAQQAARFSVNLPPFTNLRDPERRLKIGYVSADFKNHSVIHFAAPLIENHDKSRVEVFCYYNQTTHDACTDRIIAAADHWIPCLTMSDDELAQRIRDDGIDVLIDVSGHTLGNRLLVFARKPAPVQVSWMGFGYSTGLTAMDYFIGDALFTPPGSEAVFSETVYRLPHAPWAYQPQKEAPEPSPSPARQRGYVTFACVSTTTRIHACLIEAWAAILRRLPEAHLRLDTRTFRDADLRRDYEEKFAALGVPVSQLEIGYTSPVWPVYQDVDIVLDCFPHNSGTTTFEALWMGIPVVTLADRPSVGRFGASILSTIGKHEWIASDRDDYVNRAVALAQDVAGLKRTRASLREAMRHSRFLDHPAFAREMEDAYRDMWQKWCRSELKESTQS